MGDLDAAISACERGLAAAPNNPPLLRLAGDLERRRHRPVEAEAYYHRALALDPDSPLLLSELSEIVASHRHPDEDTA